MLRSTEILDEKKDLIQKNVDEARRSYTATNVQLRNHSILQIYIRYYY